MTADVDAGSIQQNSNSASTTLAINKPTGLAVGDLMLAALGCTVGTNYTGPTGWTQVDTGTSQFDGFWKIADSSDVAASTFTFTQGNALGNNRGYIIRVTDSDTTTPVEDETIQQQASSSQVGLAVTAAQANTLLVACYIATGTTVVNSVPAGMTSEVNNSTSFTKAVASLVVGSGSTGDKTFTLASSATGAVVMFAINPVPTQSVSLNSVVSTATVGSPTITPGPVTVSPDSVGAATSVGSPTVTPGAVTVSPNSVEPATSLGLPVVTPGPVTISPNSVESTVTLGLITVTPGPVTIAPESVASNTIVGQPTVTGSVLITGTVVNHETGALVEGATVRLFTDADVKVQTTTSAADGSYLFSLLTSDTNTYYVTAHYESPPGTQVHGVSDRGLTPS